MALASEAVLTALHHYIQSGGGSRGARAILDATGESTPQDASGSLENLRFRKERSEDKTHQIMVSLHDTAFHITTRENRSLDPDAKQFFESDWPAWLTGAIYGP